MKMTKIFMALVLVVGIMLQLSPVLAEEMVNIVGWGGTWNKAYEKGVWDLYTKETGVKIYQEDWNGELAKIRAQVQSNNVIHDIVSVEAVEAEIGCAEGLFEKLPPSVTGDPANYLPGTIHACGVASDTWATVLVYNADIIKGEGPKSWADFWDVKKFPGKRGLMAQAQRGFENALLADGVPISDIYTELRKPSGIDRAFAALERIRPQVVWWTSTTQAIQNLASGEVVMSDLYNARITNENENEGKNYVIVWEAGYFYGTDVWALVKGAPNKKAALDLLTWFSEPQNQAGFSKLYAYGTGRKEAADFIPKERLAQLPTSPQNFKYASTYDDQFWVENKEAIEKRFKVWLEK